MSTIEWLDRSRSDGPVGVCMRVFAKLQIVSYVAAHVAELPHDSKTRAELLKVLGIYRSYETFRTTYASVPTPGGIDAVGVTQDPFDRMQESLTFRVGKELNNLLFDIFTGSGAHDDCINKLCTEHIGPAALLVF